MTAIRIREGLVALSVVCGLYGCGGESKRDGGAAGAAGTSSSGGSSSGGSGNGGGAGAAASACPATAPAQGSACTSASTGRAAPPIFGTSADCSWGDDPRPSCRTLGTCSGGTWTIKAPPGDCSTPPKPAACPAAPATAGTQCSDSTLRCWYDDGNVCSCSGCKGGFEYPICQTIDPPEWACVKPADGCPNPAPQAGESCTDSQLNCGTSCEMPIRCVDAHWQYQGVECPICASPDTPIATPLGERPIAELAVGDLVYSVDHDAIVAVPIARIGSTPVLNHRVLHLELDSGAILEISPGHPTAAGQPLSALAAGSQLDAQHTIISTRLVPYRYARTYDILPSSTSGSYFAAGALLGSTLAR